MSGLTPCNWVIRSHLSYRTDPSLVASSWLSSQSFYLKVEDTIPRCLIISFSFVKRLMLIKRARESNRIAAFAMFYILHSTNAKKHLNSLRVPTEALHQSIALLSAAGATMVEASRRASDSRGDPHGTLSRPAP